MTDSKPEDATPAQSNLSPEARDELAMELDDFFVEAFGKPHRVVHVDGLTSPHVDVFIYEPGAVLPGWMLVTVGRSTERVAGRSVELVQHLRPEAMEDDMHDAADSLRLVSLRLGEETPGWSFKPITEEPFIGLAKLLRYNPTFLQSVYKRPA